MLRKIEMAVILALGAAGLVGAIWLVVKTVLGWL